MCKGTAFYIVFVGILVKTGLITILKYKATTNGTYFANPKLLLQLLGCQHLLMNMHFTLYYTQEQKYRLCRFPSSTTKLNM